MQSFVWKHFCFFWISQVGSHLGRPTPPTVASSQSRIGIPTFRLLLECPKQGETFRRQIFFSMWVHQSTLPCFCSSLKLLGTQQAQCSLCQGSREECEWDFSITSSWYPVMSCHCWVLLNQGLYPWEVFWGNGYCHSTTTVIVFQRSCSRHELSEPHEVALDGDWSPKQCFKPWKALLKRFSQAVVTIHHSLKIPSRKVNTAGRRPGTLARHFVMWNENVCSEPSKKFGHKYYEIGLRCNVKNKVVMSLIRLGFKTCTPCMCYT